MLKVVSVLEPGCVISAITLPKIKTGDVQLYPVSENQTPDENQTPEHVVGVGPWEGPHPEGDHWDPELLAHGDRRNVLDEYRYWKHEAIVADLNTRRHPLHIAIENWQHDFNIGTVVRTPTPSTRPPSTSWVVAAGTAAAPWSPTAT